MMTLTITKNSDPFLILESIRQRASSLSEPHLRQQYVHPDHGPTLHSLIASALCNLSRCIDIINARSPVSRLTQDVLSIIFHEVHQADLEKPDPQGTWSRPSIPAPLCLSQVSKAWKDVAMNLPTLWTTVKVTTPWSFASIKTCLSMSKLLPIDLHIKGLKKDPTFFLGQPRYHDEDCIKDLCTILLPHIPRCRSISITTDKTFWPLLQEFDIRFTDAEAPLLENISIVSTSPYDEGLCCSNELFSKGTPRLTVARFTVEALLYCHPPFGSIRTLSLKGDDYFEFGSMVDVLSECVALEVFIIHGNLVPQWVQAPTGLPLPKLRSIQLYGSAQTTTAFLQDLSTPNLTELSMVPYHLLDWTTSLTRTGHLPFHTLKALTLSNNNTSLETMRLMFNDASNCFPQIEILTLVGNDSSRMLQALTETKGAKAWPGLMKLTLPEILDPDDENALRSFVTLRKAAGLPLPSILLDRESLGRMTRLNWLKTHVSVLGFDRAPVDFGGFVFPEIKDGYMDNYNVYY